MVESSTLSDMDVRILQFLSKYGTNHPSSELAAKLRLSPSTVKYKMRKLKDDGVILGHKYRFNPFKLGYRGMAYSFLTVRPQATDTLIDLLAEEKQIASILAISGESDVMAKFFYRDEKDLNDFLMRLPLKVKAHVDHIHTRIATSVFKLHQLPMSEKDREPSALDEKDSRILHYLIENPDALRREVARDLHMHRNTVSSRIDRLYSRRVILKKSINIDPKYYRDIGVAFTTLTMIDAEVGAVRDLGNRIAQSDKVVELVSIAYPHDLMAVVRTNNAEECYSLIKSFYKMPGFVKTNTSLVFMTTTEKSLV